MDNRAKTQYKVFSRSQLSEIEQEKRDSIRNTYIIDYNGSAAFVFNDGTSMLYPPVLGGDEGLFFYDVAVMNSMIESRVYPVKGTDSFWEREKERVSRFSKEVPYYCSILSDMIKFKIELRDEPQYLKEVSEIITAKFKSKKVSKDLYYLTAIFIGELLRLRANAEWKLLPLQSFNVHYVPEIVKGSEFCTHWSYIIGQLEMASFIPVNIEVLLERANEFYPKNGREYVEIN